MSFEQIVVQLHNKLEERIDHFSNELDKIRSGRVTPALVESVKIEAYNSQMPMNQVANISTPDARTMVIEPWDKALLEDIEKALIKSDLGTMPSNDGQIIHLNFPPLSEERRKEFVKVVKKVAEECKIAMRKARREQLDALNKLDKSLSKDDIVRGEESIQKELTSFEQKVTVIADQKNKELMTV